MNPAATIQKIRKAGLNIEAVDGSLHVYPRKRITDALRHVIRSQKELLIDFLENYQERAAIMEYDAGMSRQDAEAAAFEDCMVLYEGKKQ